jgi:[protein-PII] uridylyltransferase
VVHLVLGTLAGLGLTVASAHVSTLGPQAVDVFYVQEVGGVRPTDERAAAAAHAVRGALEG